MVGGVEYWKLTATFAVIFPLVMLWLMKTRKKSENVDVNLPPGPKKLPIIGNLHLVSTPPFRSFRELSKKYGPIMHLKVGELDTIVVSSPELAKEVVKDNDPVFANRPHSLAMTIFWYNYINMAFSPYGDYWRQMRKICIVELLSNKSVRSFSSIRHDEVVRLVDSLRASAGKPVDFTTMMGDFMSSITCRAAFGKMFLKDKDSLIWLVKVATEWGAGTSIADIFPSSGIAHALSWVTKMRLMRMRRKLDVILDYIIAEHQRNRKETGGKGNGEFGNEDLVDVLLRVMESGELKFPIGSDNIKAVILDMFAAGTETSSSAVDWAIIELLRHPQAMAKAQNEIRQVVKERGTNKIEDEDIQKLSYLRLVIMEILRLHPPASVLPRHSREQCKIGGYTIPANVNVIVNIWAIHRDPKYWSIDPEAFVPERFAGDDASLDLVGNDSRYMPFGSGRRSCPGLSFGWASVVLPLAHLLYNFDWKLPEGVDAQAMNMVEANGIATPRADHLFVIATPHQH